MRWIWESKSSPGIGSWRRWERRKKKKNLERYHENINVKILNGQILLETDNGDFTRSNNVRLLYY